MKAKEIINTISSWELERKIKFLEDFLKDMTVMNRAIWGNDEYTEAEKLNCLKWSNELAHRIWNIKFELQQGTDEDCLQRFLNNLMQYRQQEPLLGGHFGATLKSTYNNSKS